LPAAILQRLAKLEAAVLPPEEPEHHHRGVRVYYLEEPGDVRADQDDFDAWFAANPCPGGCNGVPLVQWSADRGFRSWGAP
jgi:hypothetical protein